MQAAATLLADLMKSVKARFEEFDAEVDAEEAPAAAPTPARPEKRKRSEVEALGLASEAAVAAALAELREASVLHFAGTDRRGRPIVLLVVARAAPWLSAAKRDRLLLYLMTQLAPLAVGAGERGWSLLLLWQDFEWDMDIGWLKTARDRMMAEAPQVAEKQITQILGAANRNNAPMAIGGCLYYNIETYEIFQVRPRAGWGLEGLESSAPPTMEAQRLTVGVGAPCVWAGARGSGQGRSDPLQDDHR